MLRLPAHLPQEAVSIWEDSTSNPQGPELWNTIVLNKGQVMTFIEPLSKCDVSWQKVPFTLIKTSEEMERTYGLPM